MPEKIENTNIFNSFDIYECLSPCDECSASYSAVKLGLRFRCRCSCHRKQELVRGSSADRIYETGISGRKFAGIDASNLEDSGS